MASAAGFAAEKAVAAAEAAALLARAGRRMSDDQRLRNSLPNSKVDDFSTIDDQRNYPVKTSSAEYHHSFDAQNEDSVDDAGKMFRRRMTYNCDREPTDIRFDESDYDEEIEMEAPPSRDSREVNRRHSYNNVPPNVRYDEYDDDDDDAKERPRGTNRPPDRPAPHVPVRRVHPKLPDYDTIAARFEALKHHKN